MNGVYLAPSELEALAGLPAFCMKLYVQGFRAHMDYRDGTVGLHRRISWSRLARDLYVDPHQGEKDTGAPCVSRLRRTTARLEARGLIRKLSSKRSDPLAAALPLAPSDLSAPQKADKKPTRISPPPTAKPKASNGAGLRPISSTLPDMASAAKPGNYPVSEEKNTDDDLPVENGGTVDKSGAPAPTEPLSEQASKMAAFLQEQGVTFTRRSDADLLRKWAEEGLKPAEAQKAIARARKYKPAPEPIRAAYLERVIDTIVRNPTQYVHRPSYDTARREPRPEERQVYSAAHLPGDPGRLGTARPETAAHWMEQIRKGIGRSRRQNSTPA